MRPISHSPATPVLVETGASVLATRRPCQLVKSERGCYVPLWGAMGRGRSGVRGQHRRAARDSAANENRESTLRARQLRFRRGRSGRATRDRSNSQPCPKCRSGRAQNHSTERHSGLRRQRARSACRRDPTSGDRGRSGRSVLAMLLEYGSRWAGLRHRGPQTALLDPSGRCDAHSSPARRRLPTERGGSRRHLEADVVDSRRPYGLMICFLSVRAASTTAGCFSVRSSTATTSGWTSHAPTIRQPGR